MNENKNVLILPFFFVCELSTVGKIESLRQNMDQCKICDYLKQNKKPPIS